MKRTLAALVVLCLVPGLTPAIEIKNVRPSYGPLGSLRTGTKFLPGDLLFMTFDIDGLSLDEKTGKAIYDTKLEFLDDKQKVLYENKTRNEVIPNLGGARMPGDMHLIIGKEFAPGKYTVKLTVTDKQANQSKAIIYPIQVLERGFGFIGVMAPAVGLNGQSYLAEWGLVGFVPDATKAKLPLVDVTIRILDQNDKLVVPETNINLPAALPPGTNAPEFVPITLPLFLNRTGQFQIDIVAVDKNAKNAQIHMRFPLTVVDIGSVTSGK
jgi:hypothetical protein